MARHPLPAVVSATMLYWIALSGTALAVPDRIESRAEADQLPTGGQITTLVTIGESAPSSQPTGPGKETAGGTTTSQNLSTYH